MSHLLSLSTLSCFVCQGCRAAIVVAEARSAEEPVLTRRCVIMKVQDFTTEKYREAQRQNAAAILILLPRNISSIPHDTMQVPYLCSEGKNIHNKHDIISIFIIQLVRIE